MNIESQLLDILQDDKRFIETFFIIPNKDRHDVPFIFTPAQDKIHRERTLRHIVVKPSQIGSTSYATALLFKRTAFHPNTTSVVVAHESFLAQRLLNRTDKFYSHLPDAIKPVMDHDSAHEKRFPDYNSVMYIGTARSKVFGRGEPIHNLLFSECAFYPSDAWDKAIAPALQRVPPDGTVLMESTPNGMDPIFYEHIQDVLEGRSAFTLTVLCWWDEQTNVLPLSNRISRRYERSPNNDEDLLITRYGLSEDQLRWRRWKIEELGALFWQEHIEGLDTAFLVSGLAYYDSELIANLQRSYSSPIATFKGARIYAHPEEGFHYTLGGDPGQGKVTESVAAVYSIESNELVATMPSKLLPDEFADYSIQLAKYYNNAYIVPEVNGHGLAYTQKIKELGYHHTYYRTSIIDGTSKKEMGWYTSSTTKPFMMSEIHRRLREGLKVPDETTVRQLASARVEDNKILFLTLDDHHDALGLALVGATHYKPNRKRGIISKSKRYSLW